MVPTQDRFNRCFLYLNNLLGLVGMLGSVIRLYIHILHSRCLSKIPFPAAGNRRGQWHLVNHGSVGKGKCRVKQNQQVSVLRD